MGNSSSTATGRKPHKDWPLTQQSEGLWQKKVRGKRHHFGTDADAALAEWTRVNENRWSGAAKQRIGWACQRRRNNLGDAA